METTQNEKKTMNISGTAQTRALILAHITGTYSLYSPASESGFKIPDINRRINFLHQLYEDLAEAESENNIEKVGIIQLTLFNKFKRI